MRQSKAKATTGVTTSRPIGEVFETELDVFIGECREVLQYHAAHSALLNQLALNSEVQIMFSQAAIFWATTMQAHELSLHVSLSRIFDTKPDNFRVLGLLKIARKNPEILHPDNLRLRLLQKCYANAEVDRFIAEASVPTTSDFNELEKLLKPHRMFHEENLHPLRTNLYAHRIVEHQQDIRPAIPLFVDNVRLEAMLAFLDSLHTSLSAAYYFGKPIFPMTQGTFQREMDLFSEQIGRIASDILARPST